jgi:metal-responsive CopG/Arc/MetJ family transcriptional regulator
MAKSRRKRKYQKSAELILRIPVYVSATLLQRVEDALAKAGIASRSDLVVTLLENWTSDRGC